MISLDISDLAGKRVLISGASRGLGLELAKKFLQLGSHVLAFARSSPLLDNLQQKFKDTKCIFKACDVRNAECVQALVQHTVDNLGPIDILVSNAGIHGALGSVDNVELEQWQVAIETNLYGALNLTRAVLPNMRAQRAGKIIQISGGGATAPMARMSAYATSKAAVVRLMECIAEDVREVNIDVNCVAPGMLPTRLVQEVLDSGADVVGVKQHAHLSANFSSESAPFDNALDLVAFLASSASNGITGKLISAHWDHWEDFITHKDQLQGSDLLTLRRISGKDRAQAWCDREIKRSR